MQVGFGGKSRRENVFAGTAVHHMRCEEVTVTLSEAHARVLIDGDQYLVLSFVHLDLCQNFDLITPGVGRRNT